ncbi:transporter substrate-binding domain-containing protein [Lichenihabitans sp. PAMC28606]|uniref:transporter substrate-binding domain-containing protein n=1 Tax=Lichenihabitans sp. PAMC28606 TaxID=2880932 RepID=UPI001D0A40DC|nr:transporter substrate-binding domain-containing protein [Lichenihabitans sp. PAMC28606]UDL96357.1 transporter substrate-binding domain-containing protein [Lichenihabitans sp. PAMC28606]
MRWAKASGWSVVIGLLAGLAFVSVCSAEQPRLPPLRVAVYDVPPYGYVEPDGSIAGVSVDLWRRVAERLERTFELTPVSDMDAVLGGLEQNRFDVAIGAITITPERDARVDFSYPAHRSGVAVAVRKATGPLSAVMAYGAAVSDLGIMFLGILLLLISAGFGMWLVERSSRSADHGESAITTLRDGLYWAVVTMTTVGYGDKTPKTNSGRIMATLWMFGSLILVSLLSTSLVSRLTAERVEGNTAGSTIDLEGRHLAAVGQSSGAEYLEGLRLPYTRYKNLPEALDAVADNRADAVVNSVGALTYGVAKRYSGRLEMPRGLLAPAYMAFALPRGSALKGSIDQALIRITSGPEWIAIEQSFFGR